MINDCRKIIYLFKNRALSNLSAMKSGSFFQDSELTVSICVSPLIEVADDAALEDQSVMTASEGEMSGNDQVDSMEIWETNNAFAQFVGDNMDLNVSIHGNTPLNSIIWIKLTSLAPPLPDPQTAAAVPRGGVEGKILPFTNGKQTGINTVMFFPIAELSSSLAHDQPLLTLGDTFWAAVWVIKAHDPEFPHSNWNDWMKRIHGYDDAWSSRTAVLSTHEGTRNFACLQGHLRTLHCPREPCRH